jgi:methyl-accepting chemotaxis protein
MLVILINEIATSINRMVAESQKVVVAIRGIDRVNKAAAAQTQTVSAATEEQSASIAEFAAASQSLAKIAEEMKAAIRQFSI